ncbi:MAG: hypothetical protein ACRDKZ_07795 [Actinomycetota bacterium]
MAQTRSRRALVAAVVLAIVSLLVTFAARPGGTNARATGQAIKSGGRGIAHRPGGPAIRSASAPRALAFETGLPSAEPTIGVDRSGDVYTVAFQSNTRIDVLRSSDQGRKWKVISPQFGSRNAQLLSFDPYVYLDDRTDRLFTIDLTVACSYLSYTDDDGKSWTTNPLACGVPVNDHQTLFAGPPVDSPTVGYRNIVYYCFNDVLSSTCTKSLDGGITFSPTGAPAYPGFDPAAGNDLCGGLHGHGYVDRRGWVFIPKGHCGQPWLSISKDEGRSWTRVQVARNGVAHHEASVGVDRAGNIYYLWVAADRLPYLSVSKNNGKSWTKPVMVGAPRVNETNLPSLAVGRRGAVAVAYYGTTNGPGAPFKNEVECDAITSCPDPKAYDKSTWNAYVTVSNRALSRSPLLYSTTVNDPGQPLIKGTCGPGRCKAAYDFIDVVIDRRGTAWTAIVDGCLGQTCGSSLGVVGHIVGGPRLR